MLLPVDGPHWKGLVCPITVQTPEQSDHRGHKRLLASVPLGYFEDLDILVHIMLFDKRVRPTGHTVMVVRHDGSRRFKSNERSLNHQQI